MKKLWLLMACLFMASGTVVYATPKVVNWQSKAVKGKIPNWTKDLNNYATIRKAFELDKEKDTIIAFSVSGVNQQNLDNWIKINANAEVARRVITSMVSAMEGGTVGGAMGDPDIEGATQSFTTLLSQSRLPVTQEGSFWVLQTEKGKPDRYTIYAVFTVPKDLLKQAIDNAINGAIASAKTQKQRDFLNKGREFLNNAIQRDALLNQIEPEVEMMVQ